MNIGIYSGDPDLLRRQSDALADFITTSCLDLTLFSFCSHRELMLALTERPLDVLIYDTRMTERLKEEVWEVMHVIPDVSLILMGNDPAAAVFGYSVKAVAFLPIPLDPEDLVCTLARHIRSRMEAKEQFLPLKLNGIWSRVNMKHITFLESVGHSLVFHMDDGKSFRMIAGFRDYQPLLDLNRHFYRCHKSYIVNMQHVRALESNAFLMEDGSCLNISRPYRQQARSFYAVYTTDAYNAG